MRKVLSSDWGEQPERILADIQTEPAAAASIGQVYRARTRDGREVAVKVQYPGVAESVEADMRNLLLLSPLLRQLMPGLEVKDLLAELRERIVEECDYELEASNHRRVERFWRGHPFVLVPRVDTELSTRRLRRRHPPSRRSARPLRADRLPLLLCDRARARRGAR
jgi:predicted unusual protein kinase regulating ubiquinone biosynthesis (AarF/ABC1/UbiB family)